MVCHEHRAWLGALWVLSCNPAQSASAPHPVSNGLPPTVEVPAEDAAPEERDTAPEPCPSFPELVDACRAALAQFPAPPGCGPQDCAVETLSRRANIGVHTLTLEHALCDGTCEGTGLLGLPLLRDHVPPHCDTSHSDSFERQILLLEYAGQQWPTAQYDSHWTVESEHSEGVSDIRVVDTMHLTWLRHVAETRRFESDSGLPLDTERDLHFWEAIYLDASGPKYRHSTPLGQSQLSEASHPDLSAVPACGPDHPCPRACVLQR